MAQMTSLEEYVCCSSSLFAGKPAPTKITSDLDGSSGSISACSHRQLLAESRRSRTAAIGQNQPSEVPTNLRAIRSFDSLHAR